MPSLLSGSVTVFQRDGQTFDSVEASDLVSNFPLRFYTGEGSRISPLHLSGPCTAKSRISRANKRDHTFHFFPSHAQRSNETCPQRLLRWEREPGVSVAILRTSQWTRLAPLSSPLFPPIPCLLPGCPAAPTGRRPRLVRRPQHYAPPIDYSVTRAARSPTTPLSGLASVSMARIRSLLSHESLEIARRRCSGY